MPRRRLPAALKGARRPVSSRPRPRALAPARSPRPRPRPRPRPCLCLGRARARARAPRIAGPRWPAAGCRRWPASGGEPVRDQPRMRFGPTRPAAACWSISSWIFPWPSTTTGPTPWRCDAAADAGEPPAGRDNLLPAVVGCRGDRKARQGRLTPCVLKVQRKRKPGPALQCPKKTRVLVRRYGTSRHHRLGEPHESRLLVGGWRQLGVLQARLPNRRRDTAPATTCPGSKCPCKARQSECERGLARIGAAAANDLLAARRCVWLLTWPASSRPGEPGRFVRVHVLDGLRGRRGLRLVATAYHAAYTGDRGGQVTADPGPRDAHAIRNHQTVPSPRSREKPAHRRDL